MRISVYIPSFNQKAYLIEAIESVLAQTLRPHQIIVVDDCSGDGSQEVIAGYAARYPQLFTPIYHERNRGVAQTRVDALQVVTGEYVTYVDGDDRILPTKLEKEAGLLRERPLIDIVFSNNYYMNATGQRTGTWIEDERPPTGDVFLQTFSRDFPRQNLFRMELVNYRAWRQIGFHDVKLHIYEDWDMRIRLAKQLRVGYLDQPLSEIRRHGKGLASSTGRKHLRATEYIVRKNVPLLDDVTPSQRSYVRRGLDEWRAKLWRGLAREALEDELQDAPRRIRALRHYWHSLRYRPRKKGLKLLLRILLPASGYEGLRQLARSQTIGEGGGRS